jgi:hypothetical protein
MKNNSSSTMKSTKRIYIIPKVELVKIDSEISLAMMSPPGDMDPMIPISGIKVKKMFTLG